ncbi:TfoX/Sxy family protein [Pseudohalocynthiibacter aestuariivivens]|nr:TfoX/Sxy family protein [Pseudohalocynthiibacter aestuariivivens]QIE44525.1 TfoX/Sxy family protein [Pseudohalocynthiibacter aestuariivivens]
MSVSNADIAYARDLFAPLGTITHRKMMGGATFYANGTIFGILDSDSTLFLKAVDTFADRLGAAGARKFSMTRKDGKIATMGYWTMPDDALDDPNLACDWARQAIEAQQKG